LGSQGQILLDVDGKVVLNTTGQTMLLDASGLADCCCGSVTPPDHCCDLGLGYLCGLYIVGGNLDIEIDATHAGDCNVPTYTAGWGTAPVQTDNYSISSTNTDTRSYTTTPANQRCKSVEEVIVDVSTNYAGDTSTPGGAGTMSASPAYTSGTLGTGTTHVYTRATIGINQATGATPPAVTPYAFSGYTVANPAASAVSDGAVYILHEAPTYIDSFGVPRQQTSLGLVIEVDADGSTRAGTTIDYSAGSVSGTISATPILNGSCMIGFSYSYTMTVKEGAFNPVAVTYTGSGTVQIVRGVGGCDGGTGGGAGGGGLRPAGATVCSDCGTDQAREDAMD